MQAQSKPVASLFDGEFIFPFWLSMSQSEIDALMAGIYKAECVRLYRSPQVEIKPLRLNGRPINIEPAPSLFDGDMINADSWTDYSDVPDADLVVA